MAAQPAALAPVASAPPPASGTWQPWFEPQQLPRFSGTLERFVASPDGGHDSLLFREGAQVIFPPDLGPTLREAVGGGGRLVVYGLRARNAPVIVMLAWATSDDAEPRWVERPAWPRPRAWDRLSGSLRVEGVVEKRLYAANGALAGVLLEDGSVVRLPLAAAVPLAEKLKPGARVAAEGRGAEVDGVRALLADRLGERADALEPVEAPR